MTDLLKQNLKASKPGDQIRVMAQARTSIVLDDSLDEKRKKQILEFLHTAGLITKHPNSQPSIVDLGRIPPLAIRNLQGIKLSRANLRGTNLSGAQLEDADLSNADLSGVDLSNANLTRADLTNTDLRGATLRRANLTKAKLPKAILIQAQLTEANLTNTDLGGADLRGSDLDKADLNGANLSEASLEKADLKAPIPANVDLCNTIMPDGKVLQLCAYMHSFMPPPLYGVYPYQYSIKSTHIVNSRISIYSGPGQNYPRIGNVLAGTKVSLTNNVVYRDGLVWGQIDDGGWIMNRDLNH